MIIIIVVLLDTFDINIYLLTLDNLFDYSLMK